MHPQMFKRLAALLVLLLGLAGWILGNRNGRQQTAAQASSGSATAVAAGSGGMTFSNPVPAPDFTLVDHHGNPLQLSALKGKAITIFFGYTHCPDVCPATMAEMQRVYRDWVT